MSIPPPLPDESQPRPAGAAPKLTARQSWILGLVSVLFIGGILALAIFAPKVGDHLYALGLCFAFPISAVRLFLGALDLFRKGSVVMGVLLILSAGMLLLCTLLPLTALFT